MEPMTYHQIELDYETVHDLAQELLRHCQEIEATPSESSAAMTLNLGRFTSTAELSPDQEIDFIQYMSGVCRAYFAEGSVN